MADHPPTPRTRTDQASVGEVVDFVKTYARQETLGPLKGAGRWIAMGAAGAVTLGIGLSLLLLGLLRLLQSEWSRSATGRLSWISYTIVLVACLVLLVGAVLQINKTFLNKDDTS
ncbi:MAG: hypothetical protein ABIO83_00255 [Ilumatobacteraceae bacterium]